MPHFPGTGACQAVARVTPIRMELSLSGWTWAEPESAPPASGTPPPQHGARQQGCALVLKSESPNSWQALPFDLSCPGQGCASHEVTAYITLGTLRTIPATPRSSIRLINRH